MKVKSVKCTGTYEPVFNLEVEDTHNFILANGIVAHNCYDSLGYLLISRHINKSKELVGSDNRTVIQKHKEMAFKTHSLKRRRLG